MADHPLTRPELFWQATGLVHGEQTIIRYDSHGWTAQGGTPFLLDIFLTGMELAGFGWAPIGLPPDVGRWIDAAEASARAAMPGPVVFDDNFGSFWGAEPGLVY